MLARIEKCMEQLIEIQQQHLSLLTSFYELVRTGTEPVPDHLEPWLGKGQVMEYLKITESTYYRWVEQGKLQPRGEGEHRYYRSDIAAFMERRKYRQRG